ncbi:MAG TPA: zinc ribbon domain-containing protein [Anaerolineaceae bacterium]|nr:zinc ribbon domain-containing protein [Anaerolineaceae bacterium]
MPLYEYRCETCGRTFEKMAAFSQADGSPECPHCHGSQTRKQISTFATRGAAAAGSASASSCGSSGGRFT